MAKNTSYYFSHDYNARLDRKIKALLIKHSMLGYGIYWSIIEDLYNNANALRTDYEGIAYDLRTDKKVIESIIKDFDLFVIDGEFFGSISVERRLEERNEKSKKASQSANKRWQNMRTQCYGKAKVPKSDAIKERKGKEIKEKKEIEILIFPFESEKFKNHWTIWKDYKKNEHGFRYKSVITEQGALKELSELSDGLEEKAIQIIDQSITKGWKGLFQLKNTIQNGTSKTGRQEKFADYFKQKSRESGVSS